MAEIHTLCRGVLTGLQKRDIKFNHCQRELLARTYLHFLDDLEAVFRKDATMDERLRACAKALSELWRVMTYGEMLVAEWASEDWWRSVASSSTSGSLQTHVNLLLQEFLRCVDVVKIAIAEATGDHAFDIPIMDHSKSFAAIVEEAYKRDTQTLLRDIEAHKEGRTFLQRKFGMSYGLTKYLLRKLKPESTVDSEACRHYVLDSHYVEISDCSLGTGSFGTVFECKCFGMQAVAKCLASADESVLESVEKEVEVFAKLQHPNVAQFIGYAIHDGQHALVTERGGQNLRVYLAQCGAKYKRESGPLSLLTALDIMLQIGEAMKYLHEHEVVHRDLKASNVLVDVIDKKNIAREHFWSVQVKLTDFGLWKLKWSTRAGAGPTPWRAPESYQDDTEAYAKSADVYSFAMTSYEILTGREPFADLRPMDLLPSLLAGTRPALPPKEQCPLYLSAYIQRCWAAIPKDRPLFPEICNMLAYCKGALLRQSFPSPLTCVNDYDAEVLSSHLGAKWCVHEGAKGNLPLEVYTHVTFDACRSQKPTAGGKAASAVDWAKEEMKAGRHFGDWTKPSWSPDKAFRLYVRVASRGDPEALWRLGLCYELGMGTAKNEPKAVALYEQARDLKFPSAYVELGYCHAAGRGVAVSVELAKSNWASALQEQTDAGATLLCIKELLERLSADSAGCPRGSAEAHRSAAARLRELTKFDAGRRLVAGPESCNASILKGIASAPSPLLKEAVEQILQNLKEGPGDIKCTPSADLRPKVAPKPGEDGSRPDISIHISSSTLCCIVTALLCLLVAVLVKYLPWRTASYVGCCNICPVDL